MMKPLSEYEADIPATAELLPAALRTKFTALTPGYQREWARFIFGTVAEATKQRHLAVMETVLAAGYKSKRAYDQRAK